MVGGREDKSLAASTGEGSVAAGACSKGVVASSVDWRSGLPQYPQNDGRIPEKSRVRPQSTQTTCMNRRLRRSRHYFDLAVLIERNAAQFTVVLGEMHGRHDDVIGGWALHGPGRR